MNLILTKVNIFQYKASLESSFAVHLSPSFLLSFPSLGLCLDKHALWDETLFRSDPRAGQVLGADERAQQGGGDDPRHAASRRRQPAGEWIQETTPKHVAFLDIKRWMVMLQPAVTHACLPQQNESWVNLNQIQCSCSANYILLIWTSEKMRMPLKLQ